MLPNPDDECEQPLVHTSSPRLDAEFSAFDRANPDVYLAFEKFALAAIRRGREHYSATTIVERVRWHFSIEVERQDGFKINDHHRARLGRKFTLLHPEYAGFFRVRASRTRKPQPGQSWVSDAQENSDE